MIRVLLADDQALVRGGFRLILETSSPTSRSSARRRRPEAVELARKPRPDVVLMDVRMPNSTAWRRPPALGAGSPARVLILTTFDLDEYVYDAMRAGASGFLLKDVQPDQLVDAVRVVAAGEALLAPAVTRRLVDRFGRARYRAATRRRSSRGSPTARSRCCRWWPGAVERRDRRRLFLGEATVKTHVSNVVRKLGLRDRVQAVVLAYRAGLARPHP